MRNNRFLPPLLVLLLCTCGPALMLAQQNFSSTLPIVVITTNGIDIPDEPKVAGRLRIIDNGPGVMNELNDPPTHDGFMGIELRGSSSLGFPKNGYGLETWDENGDDLEVSLLGFPREEDWVLHGPFSDKSLLRNALAYELAGKIMPYAPRIRLVEVVIAGDYKGVYLFTERIKRDNDRVDIAKMTADSSSGDALTGGYILKIDKTTGSEDETFPILFESEYPADSQEDRIIRFLYHYPRPDRITSGQRGYIRNWIRTFENALASDNYLDPNNGYRRYVDLQSFVDFLIINEISRNVDGYRISTFMYKDKDSDGGRLHMGPVWDFNLAFGNADYCGGWATVGWGFNFGINCPGDFWQLPFWWDRMLQDPEFRQLLAERWQTLREGPFSNEAIAATIDSLNNEMGDAPQRNFERWPILDEYVWPNAFVGGSHDAEVEYLKNWVTGRAEWMDDNLRWLTPVREVTSPEELRVVPNPAEGMVRLEGDLARQVRTVEVIDAVGRTVLRGANTDLDLSAVAPGMYVVKALTDEGREVTLRVVRR